MHDANSYKILCVSQVGSHAKFVQICFVWNNRFSISHGRCKIKFLPYLELFNRNLDSLPRLQQDAVRAVALDDDIKLVHLILQTFRLGGILAPLRKTFPWRKQFCRLMKRTEFELKFTFVDKFHYSVTPLRHSHKYSSNRNIHVSILHSAAPLIVCLLNFSDNPTTNNQPRTIRQPMCHTL